MMSDETFTLNRKGITNCVNSIKTAIERDWGLEARTINSIPEPIATALDLLLCNVRDYIKMIAEIFSKKISYFVERNEIIAEFKKEKSEQEASIEVIKTTQSQLLQSEKMASIGSLAAGVAHEINNPVPFGIIQKHNGSISVESDVGIGSKFTIILSVNQPNTMAE